MGNHKKRRACESENFRFEADIFSREGIWSEITDFRYNEKKWRW